MISRAERTPFSDWAWTVDRWLLASVALLIVAGLVFAMAGSPPVAERLHLPTFHFVNKQAIYLVPALVVMVATSFLSPRHVRRLALVIFVVSLALVVATIFYGQEVKGAKRWIFGIQPSEFLKPAFVVLVAWAFSEGARRKDVPGNLIALLLLPIAIAPLMLQPDFGQTMLISIVWAALFFMAGLHWIWVVGLGGLGGASALLAYKFVPHVHTRIETFLEPPPPVAGVPANFQSETALESFIAGSWFGRGPGEGAIKRILPDSHTDFIFAVIGEEFGVLVCIALAAVFAFVVVRGLFSAARNERSLLPLCDSGARDAVRSAELHQHGGERASDAGQGHDAALCLLRRLLAHLAVARHGISARRHAQAAAGQGDERARRDGRSRRGVIKASA